MEERGQLRLPAIRSAFRREGVKRAKLTIIKKKTVSHFICVVSRGLSEKKSLSGIRSRMNGYDGRKFRGRGQRAVQMNEDGWLTLESECHFLDTNPNRTKM
ncbi:hypothetical protein IEQ34_019215 [Dendrobium chrysotoxum]|uniref:Uncharacterized protein n=1 Tax=Dendrobium chrysotoxum TaxID=161865 RepID=A0AAV7G6G4_DENCH|nr:hypothetical protein IEQ34_019215 [Dendrobium chrysotoxum]